MELLSFSAEQRSIRDVCLASMNQLKHLVLVFRTRYSCASSSFVWHNALLYVANDCLSAQPPSPTDEAAQEDAEFSITNDETTKRMIWFMACVDGYKALEPQFPILSSVMEGLLSTGMEKGLITVAER